MKKGKIFAVLRFMAVAFVVTFLTACTTSEVDKDSNETKTVKNESASETVDQSEASVNDKITITGSATLTVRKLIPDYVSDDTTLQCAVVTEFQDSPYVIFVGEDIAKDLQENETYVFEIEDTEVDKNLVMQDGSLSEKAAFTNYPISIKSVCKAGEDEIGLASKFLEVK